MLIAQLPQDRVLTDEWTSYLPKYKHTVAEMSELRTDGTKKHTALSLPL